MAKRSDVMPFENNFASIPKPTSIEVNFSLLPVPLFHTFFGDKTNLKTNTTINHNKIFLEKRQRNLLFEIFLYC